MVPAVIVVLASIVVVLVTGFGAPVSPCFVFIQIGLAVIDNKSTIVKCRQFVYFLASNREVGAIWDREVVAILTQRSAPYMSRVRILHIRLVRGQSFISGLVSILIVPNDVNVVGTRVLECDSDWRLRQWQASLWVCWCWL